ncbi:MAG: hypothetical protein MJ188_10700 [Treponema sp.]|nr:hypothetical protein [Treponema sp.]
MDTGKLEEKLKNLLHAGAKNSKKAFNKAEEALQTSIDKTTIRIDITKAKKQLALLQQNLGEKTTDLFNTCFLQNEETQDENLDQNIEKLSIFVQTSESASQNYSELKKIIKEINSTKKNIEALTSQLENYTPDDESKN